MNKNDREKYVKICDPKDCEYREIYRHDDGNYYECKLYTNMDCKDNYSEFKKLED